MAVEYFISYRRNSGGEVQARLIYDILCKKLGDEEKVFYDKENIVEGTFAPQIVNALRESKHFILLVNEAFVRIPPKPSFLQRLFNSKNTKKNNDWYYYEITYAIEHKRIGIDHITPVLFDKDFKFKNLPKELERFYCLDSCQNIKYLSDYAEYFDKKFVGHFGINDTHNRNYEKACAGCYKKLVDDVRQDIQVKQCMGSVIASGNAQVTVNFGVQTMPEQQFATNSDIDFDKIHFEFKTPKSAHKGEKKFFGRQEFVKKLFGKFQEQHCINIRARGGMGKTSVAYIFKDWVDNNHQGYYYKKHFITVNVNSDTTIRSAVNKNLQSLIDEAYPTRLKSDEKCDEGTLTMRIGHILAEVPKRCLLVIDVNSDDDGESENNNKNNLSAVDFPEEMEGKWDVLYLCREKIDKTYEDEDTRLKSFKVGDDIDNGAKQLFESIYGKGRLDDHQLETLLDLVFYHPLLIEQLAYYGAKYNKDYDVLCNVVAKNRLKNNSLKEFNEYNIIYNQRKVNIVPYLDALFDFDKFNDIQKYILQHFALWEYDYIPLSAIKSLLRKYRELDIEDSLYDLVDALVLTSDDEKGFRIHGLLADRIREENKEKPFDYTDYIRTICGILSGGNVDKGIRSCLRSTPIELFAEEKYLPLYKQIGGLVSFLNKMKQVRDDGWAWDFAYKAELLRRYYEYEDSQLSQKLVGEYKDKSSYHVYYDWLETQDGYDATLPDDGIVQINGTNCKFKMIKVEGGEVPMWGSFVRLNDYYIGETQVTQELYRTITKRNPSRFNEKELKTNTDNYPVECVSWFDCLEFLMQLNKITGLKFRFPTEVQWEFAARGGNYSNGYEYSGSYRFKEVAWCDENSQGSTHPVKLKESAPDYKKPNELGVFGMSGNVWEWCQDWYGKYSSEPECEPQGPSSGSSRVLRGGSWLNGASYCRVSFRNSSDPDFRDSSYGVRLALPCSPFPS